ncbi:amino acid adenylation domain-containing protein, partial [Plantactinospora solaniradicis]
MTNEVRQLIQTHREELITLLRDRDGGRHAPVTVADRSEPLPLSFAQQRLWFLAQLDPDSVEYNSQTSIPFNGNLSVEALTAALGGLVARHEVLRTRLVADADGVPYQMIDQPAPFVLPIVDLSGEPDPVAAAEAWSAADMTVPFDLAAGPLLRATLVRVRPDQHVLLISKHHVVSDQWSNAILHRDLKALYAAYSEGVEPRLAALPVQYADFAVWQRRWLTGEVLEEQLGYWRTRLADVPVLELPTDRPRPVVQSVEGAALQFTVSAEVLEGLRAVTRTAGVSMFMTLFGAFTVLLGRYSGQDDIVVGTPIANRNRAEIEGLIGFFVNTLVMRTDLSGDPTFTELLGRVRAETLAAYAHQDVPFEQLVDELGVVRDRSRSPLFQVLFNYAAGDGEDRAVRDVPAERSGPVPMPVKFDLSVALGEVGSGLVGSVQYSTVLFDDDRMVRLVGHFQRVLAAVADDAGRRLSQVPMLTEADWSALRSWNDTAAPASWTGGVPELIAARAAADPDAVAVVCGRASLRYGELDARANQLARHLAGLGVGRESVVGVCLDRSIDLAVALVAVWKAGGAYLPLDPGYPQQRLAELVTDSGAALVIGDERFPAGVAPVILSGDPAVRAAVDAPPSVAVPTLPRQLAYVIYTSGSTGRPKAVLSEHGGLANRIRWMQDRHQLMPGERVLHKTPITFDVSLWELVWPLAAGGCLVMAEPGRQGDVGYLVDLVERAGVNAMHFVPSLFHEFVQQPWAAPMQSLRLVVSSGEALSGPDVTAFYARHEHAAVENLYGPTEASIEVSYWPCLRGDDGAAIPIGAPIANTRLHVLDRLLRPVPIGAVGELYIGGGGLARGYGGRPDLTAERFIADPIASDGFRLYRTGDLASWRADGQLEYLGRADAQVKVHGFRIEPGEVEAALVAHPALSAAVVVGHGADAARRLVAYVVPTEPAGGLPGVEELRSWIGTRLPEYMIPAVFVELTSLPLTANGKVDRAALPELDSVRPDLADAYVAPSGPTQELLAGIWAELLGVDRVGVRDNFFTLGGHSLLATRVVSRIRAVFGVEVPVAALFDGPTVAELAAVVAGSAQGTDTPPMVRVDRDGLLPLSFAQQRLWFLAQLDPGSVEYNMQMPIHLADELSVEALATALGGLVARHEVLRTRLVADADGVPWQVVDPPAPFDLPLIDLSGEPDPAAAVQAWLATNAVVPFDLAAGPLFRASLLRVAADEHVLALAMHHVVGDEWSAGILRRELDVLYTAARDGTESGLPVLPVQYADFAVWQRQWLTGDVLDGQLDYWRQRLTGVPTLELPTDRPRPAQRSSAGAALKFQVPAEVVDGLRALSRDADVSMFMTVFGAFTVLLGRYSG